MFTNDLVLKDAAAANHTFKLIQLNGPASERIDAASSRTLPTMLRIKRTAGGGKNPIDRFLVQIAINIATSAGATVPIVGNVTLSVPRSDDVTDADVQNAVAYLRDFMSEANVSSLLMGSV